MQVFCEKVVEILTIFVVFSIFASPPSADGDGCTVVSAEGAAAVAPSLHDPPKCLWLGLPVVFS